MYVDDAGGAAIGSNIGKQMADFAKAATSGSFAVNEQGGEALLAAIRDMMDWHNSQRDRLTVLAQEPSLGSSNAANAMKPHVENVATDSQGFLTQLNAFAESLAHAEEAIKQAMANYRNVDGLNASKLGE